MLPDGPTPVPEKDRPALRDYWLRRVLKYGEARPLVALALAAHVVDPWGWCEVSLTGLERTRPQPRRNIERGLKLLEAHGEIVRQKRKNGRRVNLATCYRLRHDPMIEGLYALERLASAKGRTLADVLGVEVADVVAVRAHVKSRAEKRGGVLWRSADLVALAEIERLAVYVLGSGDFPSALPPHLAARTRAMLADERQQLADDDPDE
jgi:hypothetical protein